MQSKSGDWIRFEYPLEPALGAASGREHCFLQIEKIQRARGTFSVRGHAYTFALFGGSVWLDGRPNSRAGRALPVTEADLAWIRLELKRQPGLARVRARPVPST